MARARRSSGARGTRVQTLFSGTTIATNPSGVTIDGAGIVQSGVTLSVTELGYLPGVAGYPLLHSTGAGRDSTSGLTTWAGTSLGIAPGLTTLTSFVATYMRGVGSAVTLPNSIEVVFNTATTVKVGAYFLNGASTGTMGLYPSGGSIAWWAFGTA